MTAASKGVLDQLVAQGIAPQCDRAGPDPTAPRQSQPFLPPEWEQVWRGGRRQDLPQEAISRKAPRGWFREFGTPGMPRGLRFLGMTRRKLGVKGRGSWWLVPSLPFPGKSWACHLRGKEAEATGREKLPRPERGVSGGGGQRAHFACLMLRGASAPAGIVFPPPHS
jgi:hypothetical protein